MVIPEKLKVITKISRKVYFSALFLIIVIIITLGFYISHLKLSRTNKKITKSSVITSKKNNFTEIGSVKIPAIIVKKSYLQGKKDIFVLTEQKYSSNYNEAPSINIRVLADSPEYTLYLEDNNLYKYDKSTNTVSTVRKPIIDQLEIYASQINSDLAFITFMYPVENYLFNIKNNEFIKLATYDKPCGLYCGRVIFWSFIDKDTILVSQGGGDACWCNDIITTFNIKTLDINPVGEFDTGCVGNKDSFIGVYKDNIITSADIYEDQMFFKSLNRINVPNKDKTVLLDFSEMPNNIKDIMMGSNDSVLLFNSDTGGYVYNLNEDKLSQTPDLSNLMPKTIDLNDVIKTSLEEINLSEIALVTVEESQDPSYGRKQEALYITDKNNNKTELLSSRNFHTMYSNFRHFYNKQDAESTCDSSASFTFQGIIFDDNKIYATVKIDPDKSLIENCDPYYDANNTLLYIIIDLTSQKVLIKQ